jgi:hypothetical protein
VLAIKTGAYNPEIAKYSSVTLVLSTDAHGSSVLRKRLDA